LFQSWMIEGLIFLFPEKILKSTLLATIILFDPLNFIIDLYHHIRLDDQIIKLFDIEK
jgi:hypothetical protein